MSEIVRELTSKELIEQSDCKDKDLILSRLKVEGERVNRNIEALEEESSHFRYLCECYREVMKDITRHL